MSGSHEYDPNARPEGVQHGASDDWVTPGEPRSFKTAFEPDFLASYHRGVMAYTYKGVSCLKSPIDMAIYMLMIYELRPGTILEIGSYHGGAALFYRDICRNYGLETDIVTLDFQARDSQVALKEDSGIGFIEADATKLEDSALHDRLGEMKRPLMVIEDSAHTRDVTLAVLEYFKGVLRTGEFMIVEDGVIEDQGANANYGGGPNRAVYEFLKSNPGVFEIDTRYNDWFGVNASFNPNGYLRRV